MPLPPNPGQRSHPLKRTFWVPWRGHREFFTGRIHLHVDQVLQASGGQCVLESAAKRGVLFSVWSSPLAPSRSGRLFHASSLLTWAEITPLERAFRYPPQVPTHEWGELSPERQGRLLGAEGFQIRLS